MNNSAYILSVDSNPFFKEIVRKVKINCLHKNKDRPKSKNNDNMIKIIFPVEFCINCRTMVKIISDQFKLTSNQSNQFERIESIYRNWNEKINVISRKDMDAFYTHHILHSLAIAKLISLKPGTSVLDVGTGGGFPGIPLAIFFPEVRFYLVDSIGKKITVVNEVVKGIGLTNVSAEKNRAEDLNMKVDFVVSRAVAPIKDIVHWTSKLIKKGGNNDLQNGWILLKGGDLAQEIKDSGRSADEFEIGNWFEDEFFQTKKIVYITS